MSKNTDLTLSIKVEELEKLKVELSMLILELDEFRGVTCRNIKAQYYLTLGKLEYKAYNLHVKRLRLKRKIELMQILINRQEPINTENINKLLDQEFKEYLQRLRQLLEDLYEAKKWELCKPLTDEETKELRKLYRKIVTKLHPDLNPNLNEQMARLFHQATQAYENGDLKTMRYIFDLVEDCNYGDERLLTIESVDQRIKRVKESINVIRNYIEVSKTREPYTLKFILEDPQKVEQRKQELEQIMKDFRVIISQLEEKIKQMIKEHGDGRNSKNRTK